MRILVAHNRYRSEQPSGEDVVVGADVESLRRRGHVVQEYVRRSDDIAGFGLAAKAALPARVVWSPADARAVRALIRSFRPQVMHVHNTFPLISPSILREARLLGVPVVATLHNYRLFCASGLLLRDGNACTSCVGRSALPGLVHGCYRGSRAATLPVSVSISLHGTARTWSRNVDRVVVMTEFARRAVVRAGMPEERVVVRPHGVTSAMVERSMTGDDFVYVGRLSEEKGIDLLIEAWDNSFGRLSVVGDGVLAGRLRRRAAERDLDVVFHGPMAHEDARRLMAHARAVVVPSRAFETFGLTAVEAMSAGVPVIVAAHGALGELVDGAEAGLGFRPGDVADLRRALSRMDRETSARLGKQARERYARRYTMDRAMGTLERIYAAVV